MAFSSRESIFRWMSDTAEKLQSPAAQDGNHSTTARPDSDANRVPGELESLTVARGVTLGKRIRVKLTKRRRDSPDPPEKERNAYERKARHKTREDRYDYKHGVSRSKTQSRQGKTKRVRRSRKQATNDGFHASNVPRERLTLRQHAHLGIFSKGKASSPVKIRVGPNPAFSEKGLLSHRKPPLDVTTSIKDGTEERRKWSKQSSQRDTLQAESRGSISASLRPFGSAVAQLGSRIANRRQDPSSQDITSISPNKRKHAMRQPQRPPSESKGQIQPDEVSQSATPYSWSQSQLGMDSESAIELQLLYMLHAGLSKVDTGIQGQKGSQRTYCNLEELKVMLEARKAQWNCDVDNSKPGPQGSVDADETRKKDPGAHIDEKSAAGLDFTDSPNGGDINLDQVLPMNMSRRSQSLNKRKASNFLLHESHQVDLDSLAMEMEPQDDEDFYRHLDEVFHHIMEPESSFQDAGKTGHRRRLVRRHSSRVKTGRLISARTSHSPCHGPFDVPSNFQMNIDGSDLMPADTMQHNLAQERAPGIVRFQDFYEGSRRFTNEEQNANALYSTQSRKPFITDFDEYPRGFWRQNRLY